MKLKSPWKALLWEEIYTSGSIIAFLLLFVGVFAFIVWRAVRPINVEDIDFLCYLFCSLAPFTLLFHIGNSGDLHIGFPRRILLLPVPTELPVTITLFTRLLLILLLTVVLRLLCGIVIFSLPEWVGLPFLYRYIDSIREVFPYEIRYPIPIVIPMLFQGCLYLSLQFLSWLFVYAPTLVYLIVIFIVLLGGIYYLYYLLTISMHYYSSLISFREFFSLQLGGIKNHYLLIFLLIILYILFIWWLSIVVVSKTRSGSRLALKSFLLPSFPLFGQLSSKLMVQSFPNSTAAQIWFELKNSGLIIPVWTLLLWIFFTFIYTSLGGLLSYLYDYVVFLIIPHISLIFAGLVWYLRVGRRKKREMEVGVYTLSHLPMSRKERINAYWIATNINIFLALLLIFLVQSVFLYVLYRNFLVFDFSRNMEGVSTTLQIPFSQKTLFIIPLLFFNVGLVLLSGLITWLWVFSPGTLIPIAIILFCMNVPIYKFLPDVILEVPDVMREILTSPFYFLGNRNIVYEFQFIGKFLYKKIYYSLSPYPANPFVVLSFGMCIYYIAKFLIYFIIALRKGLLGKREGIILSAVFCIVFVLATPWGIYKMVNPLLLIITYLFLTSLICLSWLQMLLQAHGYRWNTSIFTFVKKRKVIILFTVFSIIFIFVTDWTISEIVGSLALNLTHLFLVVLICLSWLQLYLQTHEYHWTTPLFSFSKTRTVKQNTKEQGIILFLGHLLPILFVAILVLFHWYSEINERRCMAYLKENSLPTSLEEINEKYHAVPEDRNLSKKYFDLIPLTRESRRKEYTYLENLKSDIDKEYNNSEVRRCLNETILDFLFTDIKKGKPFPEVLYKGFKTVLEEINKPLMDRLHTISESGLEEGAYPIDLRKGYHTELPHIAELGAFAQRLCMEAILSSIEGNYEKMLNSFRCCIPIYKSLEKEPLTISQSVRLQIFNHVYRSIEWIMNHQELSQETLIELRKIIQDFSIPKEKRSIFNDSLHFDLIAMRSIFQSFYRFGIKTDRYGHIEFYDPEPAYERGQWTSLELVQTWFPLLSMIMPREIERIMIINLFHITKKYNTEVAKNETIDIVETKYMLGYLLKIFGRYNIIYFEIPSIIMKIEETRKEIQKSHIISHPGFFLYPMLHLYYPYLERMIINEIKHYIYIELIQTALAIEEFRLKNNRLPKELQELVPAYISGIPKDPGNSDEPIKYVKGDDFSFKVYSIGMDGEDDGGIEIDKIRKMYSSYHLDLVFSIYSLNIRNQEDVGGDILSYCEE